MQTSPSEAAEIDALLRKAQAAEADLADLEAETRRAREIARQARARWQIAIDKAQLRLPLEEA